MFTTILIVIGISVAAVGFFFLGMSLTQIFKGHDIDSEIATNKTCNAWASNAPYRSLARTQVPIVPTWAVMATAHRATSTMTRL